MSRGIGRLQRVVIDELAGAGGGRILWDDLKQAFPRETAQRTLHRAVRGLLDRGLAYEQHIGERRYLSLTVLGDDELCDLVEAAFAQLRAVAKTRTVSVPPLAKPTSPERKWRASRQDVGA